MTTSKRKPKLPSSGFAPDGKCHCGGKARRIDDEVFPKYKWWGCTNYPACHNWAENVRMHANRPKRTNT